MNAKEYLQMLKKLRGFYLSDVYPDYQGCAMLSEVSQNGYIIGNIHDHINIF